ncbi:diguanylate cyclase domain-containing protein [Allorhizobium sp. NPDC080224]|uniref:GGDEF domain-containing protein n=1 Tax=Allorhizobium sp. NPDC080224 TaxID=3390547 RepID=UPI003D087969
MDHSLHLPTVMIVHALITLISTIVTIYMWLRNRDSQILPLLVAAGLAGCTAMFLHSARSSLPLFLSSGVGLGLGVFAVGLYWQAVVVFEGGKASLTKASIGLIVWTALWLMPVVYQSVELRTTILGLLIAGYCFLTAEDILRKAKREPLPSRSIAAVANLIRGAVWLAPVPLSLFVGPAYAADGTTAPWFAYIVLANSMMIVLTLVALLMLAKERDELRYRLASERDPLTNLANRRTFVTEAKAALSQEGGTSLLLLDIDHFKTVNDSHGHATGDQVLIAFSRAIEQRMPKGCLFARLGGEEFACLLPRIGVQQALALAEELRLTVAGMAMSPLSPLQVTVSIGVAEASASGEDLDMLLASADAALYRAKADGRNCVRLCEPAVLLDDTAAMLALAVAKPGRSAPRIRRRGK